MKARTFVIESTHLRGFDHGWGNGYVAVPPGHHLHGKDYDEVSEMVYAHWGLTYSGSLSGEDDLWIKRGHAPADLVGWWVFGFDTMHSGDTQDNWPKSRVEEHTKEIADQIDLLEEGFPK